MPRLSLSLSQKVLLTFILVLLPILIVFSVSYENTKRNIVRLVLENLRILADEREADLLQFMDMIRARVEDVSTDGLIMGQLENLRKGVEPDSRYLSGHLVEKKMPLMKNIYRVYIMSSKGRVIGSTYTAAVGEDVSGEDYFVNGARGIAITERDSGFSGTPEFAVSAPVRGSDGGVIGVVAGFVPFTSLEKLFSGEHIKELGAISWNILRNRRTLDIYLVNRDRLMITASRFVPGSVLKAKVDTPPVRECLERGRETTGMYDDYRGVAVAGASMCFSRMNWVLMVEINEDEILAPVSKTARYALMTVAITVVLIGVLVLYFSQVVIRQLKNLASASRRVAEGDYDVRLPVKAGDEIGVLSESFNNMAGEIKDRAERLMDSEERLRSILDNTINVVYLKDPEGRYLLINRRYEIIFNTRKEEIYGKTDYDIFPREVADSLRENDFKALNSPSPLEFEENVPQKDGIRAYLSIKFRMYDSRGKFYALCGVSTDITDLKRSEEALRRSEASLANAQRIAHVGNWDWDIAKNELRWSDEIYRIFGVQPGEFGATYDAFLGYVHPDDRDSIIRSVDEALYDKKPYSIDHRIVLKDGSGRVVHEEGEAAFGEDGRPLRMSGTVQDITERKIAEERLRQSEVKYRTLVDNALVGVYRTNIKGDILYANRALARMFEFGSPEEFISSGLLSRYKDIKVRERLIEELRRSARVEAVEVEGVTKTGKIKDIILTATIEGDIVSGMVLDITERKRAEEEVRRLYGELEKRVMERTAELDAANRGLESANRELESFSYSVAHDLRTPLRLMDGFSHVLYEDYRNRLDPKGLDYLIRLRKASQRMGQLIDDLLELSSVSRVELRLGRVSLSAIARSIAADLQRSEPERKAEFVIEQGLLARADLRLIQIVLENLLRNAWKFTGKTPVARIEFGASGTEGGRAVYRVRDNGAGFNVKYSGKLFEPFQRLHSSDEFPGTGVGLATVARIIQRHGGRVWAEGEVGRGASFYFTL